MWGQIERFTKVCAERAIDLGTFLESFKVKMACETLNPRWCDSGILSQIAVMHGDGTITVDSSSAERRQFLTEVLESAEDEHILEQLYKYTANVILLVRTRLEAEKSVEKQLEQIIDVEAVAE